MLHRGTNEKFDQRRETFAVAPQPRLGRCKITAAMSFGHVAGDRPRRPGETDQRFIRRQGRAHLGYRVVHGRQMPANPVDIEIADSMPDGWQLWLEWLEAIAPDNQLEIQSLQADGGSFLTYNRVVARRRSNVRLEEPLTSIPSNYSQQSLLRLHS